MKKRSSDQAAYKKNDSGFACVLHRDPLVITSWSGTDLDLGVLSVEDAFLGQSAIILLLPTWTLELGGGERLAQQICHHRAFNFGHKTVPVVNTPGEVECLRNSGVSCYLVNANCLLNDQVFKPLPEVERQFDAIYNATLLRWKRHELARKISSLALLTYMYGDKAEIQGVLQDIRADNPAAVMLNPPDGDGFHRLPANEVNTMYARCRVGLCLSAAEGSMRVPVEYMMAGLPVVSTRSIGGRDYFFDDDFCIVTDDDPRQIRDAVSALVNRNVPRDHVRKRIMAKIEKEREKFIAMVVNLIGNDNCEQTVRDNFERHLRNDGHGLFHWNSPLADLVRQEEECNDV